MHGRLRRSPGALAATLALAFVAGAGGLEGQIRVGDATLEFGGRVQGQAAHTSADGAPTADFFMRRVRLAADLTLNEWVDARIQHDFVSGSGLKDAWVRFTAGPGLRVSMGQFKRAFDIFQLSSSTELSVIERDGRVPGVSACSGVGRICSLSRFTDALGYGDRDVGVRVEGEVGPGLEYLATLTNGTGTNVADENDAKSVAGRISVPLSDRIRVSGNVSVHDYPDPGEETDYGTAWGGDLELGDFRTEGAHLQLGLIGGENWRNLDVDGDPSTFVATQGILTWYRPTASGGPVVAVEPLARLGWADPDTDTADDGGFLLSPGVMFYFGGRNKIGANVDLYAPEEGNTEFSLKVQSFFHF